MPETMPLLITAGAIFGLVVAAVLLLQPPTQTAASRVSRYTAYAVSSSRRMSPGARVDVQGPRERIFKPLTDRLVRLASSTAPANVRKATAQDLMMAGSSMRPTTFLAIRGAIMIGLPVLGALYVLTTPNAGTVGWGFFGMMIIWSRRLPTMLLRRRVKARQKAIDRRLPYALDLMVACLEGGLSLEGALMKVAEQSEGPLAFEIRKTLQQLALGRPTAETLTALGERTGAPDLKRLCGNIVQAERMGVSIAESLRTLAKDSRVRRKQAAEEMARKAPIKMVPVLIFCVLPALGCVIMTPAVILFVRTLNKAGGGG